ncbi:MAG TPA: GIY-YIG nuclease family protein [Bacteroidetes bacterium]|nr:GIY-YIG nuclease superfamily protein [bacterium BMS3Bbin04]HDO65825.1 GIY-YIG nuclease family protein [Bacteroidota bacterium]HEX04950.1 GIY-YIG nuclease family protein [Bacteroidota bacterium]
MNCFFVYILNSIQYPDRHYTGITRDVEKRLAAHNAGQSLHTSKFKPWRLETYVAFSDEIKARAFKKYLKSGSGCAFAKKRL